MSRTEAKRRFSIEDHLRATAGMCMGMAACMCFMCAWFEVCVVCHARVFEVKSVLCFKCMYVLMCFNDMCA